VPNGPGRRTSGGRSIPGMPTELLPDAAPSGGGLTDPQAVTEAFLEALAASDLDRAMAYLADDVVYTNVGLPTLRGRDRVARALGGLQRPTSSFEVYLHSISADGPVVLTERTDVIALGPFRSQFWVWGRFDVHDGLITLWRDSFDFVDLVRAGVRGLVGMAVPSVRPAPPGPGDPPGR
jgi:limonene-1,2-epoxide hydrolase